MGRIQCVIFTVSLGILQVGAKINAPFRPGDLRAGESLSNDHFSELEGGAAGGGGGGEGALGLVGV